jgi:hypothetical protein
MKSREVASTVEVLSREPRLDQDEALREIERAGVPPSDAWRLYQLVPIAFCHLLFAAKGVGFPPRFIERHNGTDVSREFAQESIYNQAMAVAASRVERGNPIDMLLPVARYSAEFETICALLGSGAALENIRLVEPVFMPYCA